MYRKTSVFRPSALRRTLLIIANERVSQLFDPTHMNIGVTIGPHVSGSIYQKWQQKRLFDDPENGSMIVKNSLMSMANPQLNGTSSDFNRSRRLQQVLSLSAFLFSWVANSEMLQGISSGSLCPGGVAYDNPSAITWFSYNYMIIGLSVVYLYVVRRRNWTLSFYVRHVWPGRLGLRKAVLACAVISQTLTLLNVLLIFGLECISVGLSNAVYQLQIVFSVGLSVCLLKDRFGPSEVVGVLVSVTGIALIAFPPLAWDEHVENDGLTGADRRRLMCPSLSHPTQVGIAATVASAAIGGTYLVLWRAFDEIRRSDSTASRSTSATHFEQSPPPGERLEGLIDTHMTLAVIGICNMVLGWPVPLLAHWMGSEISQLLPPTLSHWRILHLNGLVEFSFDASCAIAIYLTSPVTVAIVSPLTIPLSLLADQALYDSAPKAPTEKVLMLMGVLITLLGVMILEAKPDMSRCFR